MPEEEQEIGDENTDNMICETVKSAVTSKEDEVYFLQELKSMFSDSEVNGNLDELINECKEQEKKLKKIKDMTCPA